MRSLLAAFILALSAGTLFSRSVAALDKVALFESRVRERTDDFLSRTMLAGMYLEEANRLGRFDRLVKAQAEAETVVASHSDYLNAQGVLLSTLLARHRFKDVIARESDAEKIHGDKLQLLMPLGDARFELGDRAGALEAYDRAIKNGGDEQPGLLVRKARVLAANGDDDGAKKLLRAALEIEQNDPILPEDLAYFRVKLGEFLFMRGNFSEAKKLYEAALRDLPDSALALEHLAETEAQEGKSNEALEHLTRAYAASPRPEILVEKGQVLVNAGKREEGLAVLREARKQFEATVAAGETIHLHHLSNLLADDLDSPSESLEFAQRDLAERKTVATLDATAWALYKVGRFEEAKNRMNEALELGVNDAHVFHHAAIVLGASGDLKRSKEMLGRAREKNSRYAAFHFHR